MLTPLEVHRILTQLTIASKKNQAYFAEIDVDEYGVTPAEGNAAYLETQFKEYRAALTFEGDRAGEAFAMTEMSRILAICLRECIRMDWDFIQVLRDGVDYETDTVDDYKFGRRTRSNRALDLEAANGG